MSEELKKLANAATKGNWTAFVGHKTFAVLINKDAKNPVIEWNGFDSSCQPLKKQKANAKFIAAAQPSVVIELLERLKNAESLLKDLKKERPGGVYFSKWIDKIDKALGL